MQPRQNPQFLIEPLADIRYHLIARSGYELRNEALKTIARQFLKCDEMSVELVSDGQWNGYKSQA